MKVRILTAAIGICVLLPILFFSHTVVLPIAVAVFTAMGVWEMLGCIGMKKHLDVTIPAILIACVLPFGARYLVAAKSLSHFITLFAGTAFVYMFYLLALAVVSHGKKTVADVSIAFVTAMYVIVGFTSIQILRDLEYGIYYFASVFVCPWFSDAAGYFVGRALGKHKLIPDVSPKKTVEGAIGGLVFGAIGMVLVGVAANLIDGLTPNYIGLAILGLILAVISILGDLVASIIKRTYDIKDYGWLFPGHGGVMDRFDSTVAVAGFLLIAVSQPEIFRLFIA